ncbi:GNAT family N-acetyltransferase [Massilia cavernae]|uniref:N-acetyltransferase n=1 Tax=Massilia cavernae TaxID=2320864 RepID=A0A418XSA3_9BURK|nr:N-acetyltransferase [Massilia cavernae]RJG15423.1 N-acetyltransferase [Massilia cavernae]
MYPDIRGETPADARAIRALTEAAFRAAPHTSHTEQFIVDALRRAGVLSLSLVADEGGALAGHVAVSPVTVSDGSGGWYGLGPISVLPARQGKGIGSLLMDAALAELRRMGAAGCVVLGDPAYYSRFGFEASPRLALPGVPAEYFQSVKFGASCAQGDVCYHAAFDARA